MLEKTGTEKHTAVELQVWKKRKKGNNIWTGVNIFEKTAKFAKTERGLVREAYLDIKCALICKTAFPPLPQKNLHGVAW